MKVTMFREGHTMYGFEPEDAETAGELRMHFPDATWLGRVMYADQHYAQGVVNVLEDFGVEIDVV